MSNIAYDDFRILVKRNVDGAYDLLAITADSLRSRPPIATPSRSHSDV